MYDALIHLYAHKCVSIVIKLELAATAAAVYEVGAGGRPGRPNHTKTCQCQKRFAIVNAGAKIIYGITIIRTPHTNKMHIRLRISK